MGYNYIGIVLEQKKKLERTKVRRIEEEKKRKTRGGEGDKRIKEKEGELVSKPGLL